MSIIISSAMVMFHSVKKDTLTLIRVTSFIFVKRLLRNGREAMVLPAGKLSASRDGLSGLTCNRLSTTRSPQSNGFLPLSSAFRKPCLQLLKVLFQGVKKQGYHPDPQLAVYKQKARINLPFFSRSLPFLLSHSEIG